MEDLKNIKLIASDLDGTLLNINGKLSKKTIDTINKIKKLNYKFVVISGRPIYSLSDEVLNLPADYIVCMNGQYILNKHTNELHEEKKLNFNDIKEINKLGNKNFCITNIHTEKYTHLVMDKKFFIFGFIYDFLNRLRFIVKQRRKTKVKYHTNINKVNINEIAKVCFISTKWNLKNLVKDINSIENTPYECFLVADNWLEVQVKNINKGNALKYICNKENISLDNVIVFGDGENDISMFKIAKTSVAMANAMPNLKNISTYITDSFINDGVSNFIEKYLLKNKV